MWGLIIGVFIALNFVSTIIILSACVISGRHPKQEPLVAHNDVSEEVELAVAISKLRQIELSSIPA